MEARKAEVDDDDDDMAADTKSEPVREETPSSIESSPEPDAGAEPSQEPAQPQKRKGGRKPIYATSEERKQRNRQAQAAFRERRTEYIKQLEATIKQNEEQLSSLQQSQRTAADECLMLRYKNSLLERILLEKGVDVKTELALKTGSMNFHHPGANIPQITPAPPQLQRTAIQRHHARRSGHFLPKLAPTIAASDATLHRSPSGHPTPSSHASSPTSISARSPMVMQTGSGTPPPSGGIAPPPPQQQQYRNFARTSQQPSNKPIFPAAQQISPSARPGPSPHYQSSASVHSSHSTASRQSIAPAVNATPVNPNPGHGASHLYSDPFQKHIDQLEREYDAQHARPLLDEADPDDLANTSPDRLHGAFPPVYDPHQQPPHGHPQQQEDYYMDVSPQHPQHMLAGGNHPAGPDGHFAAMDGMIDPNDPMLDADPFGLSASMHYPTAYSFEQAPQR